MPRYPRTSIRALGPLPKPFSETSLVMVILVQLLHRPLICHLNRDVQRPEITSVSPSRLTKRSWTSRASELRSNASLSAVISRRCCGTR